MAPISVTLSDYGLKDRAPVRPSAFKIGRCGGGIISKVDQVEVQFRLPTISSAIVFVQIGSVSSVLENGIIKIASERLGEFTIWQLQ